MITSIVGILISVVYVLPKDYTWGMTFTIFFTLMFMASMISMTYGPDTALYPVGQKKGK
ncbi:hypothetical protein KY347_00415 [Candidatus Woesearchaeota archaeon]|nr:hypothetical protein [Candidatus Woesearchaeota archaeon]